MERKTQRMLTWKCSLRLIDVMKASHSLWPRAINPGINHNLVQQSKHLAHAMSIDTKQAKKW
jgi:hypothetical protein